MQLPTPGPPGGPLTGPWWHRRSGPLDVAAPRGELAARSCGPAQGLLGSCTSRWGGGMGVKNVLQTVLVTSVSV